MAALAARPVCAERGEKVGEGGAYVEVLDEGLAVCLEVGIVLGRKLSCRTISHRGRRRSGGPSL